MAHTDTVNVDPKKWTFPPFSATRDGGYVYGRGAVDDKHDVAAGLMTMLRLKREKVALDRDVIFLVEAGEEGTSRVGILFMANEHFDAIDAEYCLRRGRRRHAHRRRGEVRLGRDDREDSARHRAHRARAGRTRLDSAGEQRAHAPLRGGGRRGDLDAADQAERDHAAYFKRLATDLHA